MSISKIYTLRKQFYSAKLRKNVALQVDYYEVNVAVSEFIPFGKYIEARCVTDDDISMLPFGIVYYIGQEEFLLFDTNIHQYVFYDQEYARNYHLDTLDFEVDKLLYNRDIKFAQYLFCTMHRLYPIEIYGMRLYVNKDEFAEHSVVFQAAIAFDALKPDNKQNSIDSWNIESLIPETIQCSADALHGVLLLEFANEYIVTELNVGHLLEMAALLKLEIAFKKCINYFKMTSRHRFKLDHVIALSLHLTYEHAVRILTYCDFNTLKSFVYLPDWKSLNIQTQVVILGAIYTGPRIYR